MHCNNLRLVLGLELVRVSSRVRVKIRVRVRVSVMVRVRVSIRTSWVVNTFRCYRPVIYTRPAVPRSRTAGRGRAVPQTNNLAIYVTVRSPISF